MHPIKQNNKNLLILLSFITSITLVGILPFKIDEIDAFWHLWAGKLIHNLSYVPSIDLACYTSSNTEWININWLAQWILYKCYLCLGYAGPLLLGGILCLLSIFFILNRTKDINIHPYVLLPALFLLFLGIATGIGVRPRMWSFCLLALVLALLKPEKDHETLNKYQILSLGLIFIIWNNLHGGVIYGYFALGVDALVSFGYWFFNSNQNSKNRFMSIIVIALIGIISFGLHPHGYNALLHILTYKEQISPIFYRTIDELKPTPFNNPAGEFKILYITLFLGELLFAFKKLKPQKILPLRTVLIIFVFLIYAIFVKRGFTIFTIASFPLMLELATLMLEKHIKCTPSLDYKSTASNIQKIIFVSAIVLWGGYIILKSTLDSPQSLKTDFVFPTNTINAVLKTKGRIFNAYNLGGPLAWELTQNHRIFIDGRGDLHTASQAIIDYDIVENLRQGWQGVFRKYNISVVVFDSNSQLVSKLKSQKKWQEIFNNKRYSILVKE